MVSPITSNYQARKPQLHGGAHSNATGALSGIFLAIFFPVLYAVAGFIGGVISAALYNLVARWTGGIEFEVTDATGAPPVI